MLSSIATRAPLARSRQPTPEGRRSSAALSSCCRLATTPGCRWKRSAKPGTAPSRAGLHHVLAAQVVAGFAPDTGAGGAARRRRGASRHGSPPATARHSLPAGRPRPARGGGRGPSGFSSLNWCRPAPAWNARRWRAARRASSPSAAGAAPQFTISRSRPTDISKASVPAWAKRSAPRGSPPGRGVARARPAARRHRTITSVRPACRRWKPVSGRSIGRAAARLALRQHQVDQRGASPPACR